MGRNGLQEFMAAPPRVQALFLRRIRRHVDRLHEVDLRVLAAQGVSPRRIAHPLPDDLRWGDRWRKRAAAIRGREERGIVEEELGRELDRLTEIDAAEYVEELTGAEVMPSGYVQCPLPDHEDRTASFRCKGSTFNCFGCGAHGSIYEFAGLLWGFERWGSQFIEIHKRLVEVFPP